MKFQRNVIPHHVRMEALAQEHFMNSTVPVWQVTLAVSVNWVR